MRIDGKTDAGVPQNIFFIALFLVFLVALFYAGKWGGASVSHEIAMLAYHGWIRNNVTPDSDALKKSEQLLVWSIAMDSANAKYFYDRGRFYTFSALITSDLEERRTLFLRKAVEDFREATELRPFWPVAWADLALAKSKLNMIDQEYVNAVEMAVLHGNFRISIYPTLIESSLIQWNKVPPDLQQSIIGLIRLGLETEAKKNIILIIQASNMCKMLYDRGILPKKYCSHH